MKGYFAIGAERISKPMNVGSLFRSAHAFGASFVFTIDSPQPARSAGSDTSRVTKGLPYYEWDAVSEMRLPRHCQLVGIELVEGAADLPSFRHPSSAAYILGPEKGSLSPEVQTLCQHIIKIPTRFCINVGTAGAIAMYDRLVSLGNFPERPVFPGGPKAPSEADGWQSPRPIGLDRPN